MWTRCDDQPNCNGYESHTWNPDSNVVSHVPFALPQSLNGPFCAGHCWFLDPADAVGATKVPKLMMGGGRDPVTGRGSYQVEVFDPVTVSWGLHSTITYSHETRGYYYPSLFPLHETASGRYGVLFLGGSHFNTNLSSLCVEGQAPPGPSALTSSFFTWSHSSTLSWDRWTSPRFWHQYPRAFVLSSGELLQVGHAVTCETAASTCGATVSHFDPAEGSDAVHPAPQASPCPELGYGGDPTSRLVGVGGSGAQVLGGVNPNDSSHPTHSSLDVDTSSDQLLRWQAAWASQGRNVGSWHYCNAAIMHTLAPGWQWSAAEVPGDLSDYQLDRVFVSGGVYKQFPGFSEGATAGVNERAYYGIRMCLEYDSAVGVWRRKADPAYERALGSNFVLLPDSTLLSVGGARDNSDLADRQNTVPEILKPGQPGAPGYWWDQRERYRTKEGYFYPRNYHSIALLLRTGEVAVLGGKQMGLDDDPAKSGMLDSRDVVEVFRPGYMTVPSRPEVRVTDNVMRYPGASSLSFISVKVDSQISEVDHAVLIGAPSVTHHFDYGQRLVELKVRPSSSVPGNQYVDILAPPNDRLAPPGMYLLFVVSQDGLPSDGHFVQVDYQ